mmetsp:Transcript_4818/g.13374  ORF Transcript_4818/g.13374 Transcript_4818/m.13374 type:complete len:200 (-) Transcript_4818:158-757(-)
MTVLRCLPHLQNRLRAPLRCPPDDLGIGIGALPADARPGVRVGAQRVVVEVVPRSHVVGVIPGGPPKAAVEIQGVLRERCVIGRDFRLAVAGVPHTRVALRALLPEQLEELVSLRVCIVDRRHGFRLAPLRLLLTLGLLAGSGPLLAFPLAFHLALPLALPLAVLRSRQLLLRGGVGEEGVLAAHQQFAGIFCEQRARR